MATDIAKNLRAIKDRLQGTEARLVAVSKFHPLEALMQAYDAGQRLFGENRVQELQRKVPGMPADVQWHFIGHLQTNKVKALLGLTPGVALIESIDSEHLLQAVDKEAARRGITVRVLMQVHVAREETKTGFLPEELMAYFRERRFEALQAVHICGVMGMASNTDDMDRVRADFEAIRDIYRRILDTCPDLRGFDTLSMGMSGDWPLAVECGSNLIRVGTAIFGTREY